MSRVDPSGLQAGSHGAPHARGAPADLALAHVGLAETDLGSGATSRYPETRIRAFAFLSAAGIGVDASPSPCELWGYEAGWIGPASGKHDALLVHNCRIIDYTKELQLKDDNLARRHLRASMRRAGLPDPDRAHHVIPWEMRSHEVVKRAARGGFNINGVANAADLPYVRHPSSHTRYNSGVRTVLDDLLESHPDLSDVQYADRLRSYATQVREGLNRTTRRLR